MRFPKQRISEYVPTACLVCGTRFGTRDKTLVFVAHCDDCRATYTWHPGEDKPTAQLDKHKPVKCGCGGCGR